MTRTLFKLALGASLAWLASPSDVFAGRGGGRGGGGGGAPSRGGMGGTPSFNQGRPPMNESRPPGGMESGNRSSTGSRPQSGYQPEPGTRPQSGNTPSASNRSHNPSTAGAAAAGAGYSNRNQQPAHSNADAAAAGAGASNRNQQPAHPNGRAAAAAGSSNRNEPPAHPNAAPAAAGAGYANRNDQPAHPNAAPAAVGAGYANRNNQPNYPNAGAAAAGAGYANRNNQPNYPNAGAAAAGAGYANRNNQSNYPNAGAAAVGAGYANRNNQPNYPNAGAAAVGAGYANRNQYDQYHPGMVNGYWNGNNSAAWGAMGVGLGASTGVGAWGAGSPMYNYGYSGYSNPYAGTGGGAGGVVQAGAAPPAGGGSPGYNYSEPISTTAAPPEPTVADQATSSFDQARAAFKAGDYPNALQLVQQALTQMPNDTTLHEFLGLVLFAQGQYEQAAAPLYAVLSVGPGWDWTTLSGMYPDVATYTGQLRNLEAYITANPKSANARFVLAYEYLCEGHDENAITQLKEVVKLQPGDTLSAQLVAKSQPAPAAPTAAPAPNVDAKLSGKWAAIPAPGANITLAIEDDGRFSWVTSATGKAPATIAGTSTFADGVLTLADEKGQNGALAGNVVWKDPAHFNFRIAGSPPADPGLNFAR